MKKIFLLKFILLLGCSQNTVSKDIGNLVISENVTMQQFKTSLIEYSKNNPYPDIDE